MTADLRDYLRKFSQLMTREERETYVARNIFPVSDAGYYTTETATPLCLTGDPGSGKTVFLKMLAIHHAEHTHKLGVVPYFLALRLYEGDLLPQEPSSVVSRIGFAEPAESLVSETLEKGNALVLLDGLDELLPELRQSFLDLLSAWIHAYPGTRWVVSARPVAIVNMPDSFHMVRLPPFSHAETHKLASKLLPRSMAEGFIAAVSGSAMYSKVAHNPLFLKLLVSVFRETAVLPERRGDFYSTMVDISLRQWDKQRGLARSDRYLDPANTERALSSLALRLLLEGRHVFDEDDWSQVCSQLDIPESSSQADPILTLSEELVRNSFVRTTPPSRYEFVHLTVQEYFAAQALTRSAADEAKRLLGQLRNPEVAALFGELAEDGTPYAEYLIENGQIDTALHYVEQYGLSDTSRRRLIMLVAEKFGVTMGPPETTGSQPFHETIQSALRELWNRCLSETSRYQRGLLFEQFTEQFLNPAFRIIDKRVTTDYGEIDLVCEVKQIDPFWMRWSGDYFIECKNQEANTPVSTVNEFIGKALAVHAPLCFVISSSTFTSPALDRIARAWSDTGSPDVAWIQWQDLDDWLKGTESVSDFLKRIVRRAQWGGR